MISSKLICRARARNPSNDDNREVQVPPKRRSFAECSTSRQLSCARGRCVFELRMKVDIGHVLITEVARVVVEAECLAMPSASSARSAVAMSKRFPWGELQDQSARRLHRRHRESGFHCAAKSSKPLSIQAGGTGRERIKVRPDRRTRESLDDLSGPS
jgi:hypothetical protein